MRKPPGIGCGEPAGSGSTPRGNYVVITRICGPATAAFLLVLASSSPALADTSVTADLQPVNDSGVVGTATLTATDAGKFTVVIRARGLLPGQPHAQHVHGTTGGEHFICPSMENDTDGDGVLTNEEATGEYGTLFASLTTSGDTSPDSGLALDRMPVADSSGRINYRRTISADDVPDGLVRNLSEVHVVLHGIDANGNGTYDLDGLGESTFAKNLGVAGVPEEATNPTSCGVVTGARAPMPPHGGVETGGDPSNRAMDVTLGTLGGLLVLMSGALLFARRSVRG